MAETATLDASTGRERLFDDPVVVRLPLDAGESIPPHSHPGETVVCYVAHGRLDVVLDDDAHRVEADGLLRFDGGREIAVEAVEDSLALLVLVERA